MKKTLIQLSSVNKNPSGNHTIAGHEIPTDGTKVDPSQIYTLVAPKSSGLANKFDPGDVVAITVERHEMPDASES